MEKNGRTLRKDLAIICRGIREFGCILPGQMGHVFRRSLLAAGIPFITTAVSAYIMDGLVSSRDRGKLLMLCLGGIGLLFLVSMWRNYEDCRIGVGYQRLFSSHEIRLTNQAYSLPYELLERDRTRQLRDEVSGSLHLSGAGMASLYWDMDVLWTNLATGIIAGGILLYSMWKIMLVELAARVQNAVSADLAGGGMQNGVPAELAAGTVQSGIVVVVLGFGLLVACSCLLACRMTGKRFDVTFETFLKGAGHSRYGDFYHMEYLQDEDAAMDARIYRQEELVLEQCQSNCHAYLADSKEREFSAVNRYEGVKLAASCVCGCVVYLLVGGMAMEGVIGCGSIVLLYSAVTWLIEALARIAEIVTDLRNNNEHLLRYFQYMDLPQSTLNGREEEKQPREDGKEKPWDGQREHGINACLRMEDVSFRYPESDDFALKNVTLNINAGEKIAIVGENGSGKTTLIKLLCRLYEPQAGRILLEGRDIRSCPYEEYIEHISTVFQDFSLFAFSIAENVAGTQDYDEQKVWAALEKAGMKERVERYKRGIRQPLFHDFDSEGTNLSGGEGQKLAIARAAYKDAEIMILDEPTAALDPYAEYEIYENFGKLAEGRTVLFVSHRLSSCRMCDRIVVLDRGEVVQCGTYEELMAEESGKYRELWDAQAQYYV